MRALISSWKRSALLFSACGLLGAGCGGTLGEVKARASSDLTCPTDQLNVKELGGNRYLAVGCGQQATCTAGDGPAYCQKTQPSDSAPADPSSTQ